MHFSNPSALWGLLLIAIPILIHLFSFRRAKRILFSDIRFLKQIQETTKKRESVLHKWILASRIAALLFTIVAFAGLLWNSDSNSSSQQRYVSIFIDNSESMGIPAENGTLLDEARTAAKSLVAQFKPSDRFQLLTQSMQAQEFRFLSKEEFLSRLSQVQIVSATNSIGRILRKQAQLLKEKSGSGERFLISDFQSSFLDDSVKIEPNDRLKTRLIRLNAAKHANVFIDSAWFSSPFLMVNETLELVFRTANSGDEEVPAVPVTLSVNEEKKGVTSVSLPPHSKRLDTLRFQLNSTGWKNIQLDLTDFPIHFDDHYYLSARVRSTIPVTLVYENELLPAWRSFFSSEPFFQPSFQEIKTLDYGQLEKSKMIILDNLSSISSGLSEALQKQMKKGGSTLLFPSAKSDLNTYNAFLSKWGIEWQSGLTQALKVSRLELQHPVFKSVFEKLPENTDLPTASFYFPSIVSNRSSARKLAEFTQGEAYLSDVTLGNGHLYFSQVPLATEFTNLSVHALFVPFVHRVCLLSDKTIENAYYLGKLNIIPVETPNTESESPLILKNAKREYIPKIILQEAENCALQLDNDTELEEGFYRIIRKGQDSILSEIALNANRKESNLEYLTAGEFKNFAEKNNFSAYSLDQAAQAGSTLKENSIWKWFVILALLSLLLETLLFRSKKWK